MSMIHNDEIWFDQMLEEMKRERFEIHFEIVRESVPVMQPDGTPSQTSRMGHVWNECHVRHETDTDIPEGAQRPGIIIVMDDPARAIEELQRYRERFV